MKELTPTGVFITEKERKELADALEKPHPKNVVGPAPLFVAELLKKYQEMLPGDYILLRISKSTGEVFVEIGEPC
jgi:hypothetical protein